MSIKSIKFLTKATLLSTTALIMTGCVQHLSQQQCKSMNWYQIGYNDGMQGKYQRSLKQDISDCAKFKLTVNTKAYAKGWRAGTRVYCRPSTAYNLGVNGQYYNRVCPSDLAGRFNRAWLKGLRRYCVPNKGYNLGASGKPFPNFCPSDLVAPFRSAYNSGFRHFTREQQLHAALNSVNQQIVNAQNQIRHENHDIHYWNSQLNAGFPRIMNPYVRRRKRHELYRKIGNARMTIQELEQNLNRLFWRRNSLQRQIANS